MSSVSTGGSSPNLNGFSTNAQEAQQSIQAAMRTRLITETWLDVRSRQLTEAIQSGRNTKLEIDRKLEAFSKCYQEVVESHGMVTACIELKEIPGVVESMADYLEAKELVHIEAILFSENLGSRPSKQSCVLCKGAHSPRRCPKYTDANIDKRYQMAGKHQLCFRCLREGHRRGNCTMICFHCGSNEHHGTLCWFKQSAKKLQQVTPSGVSDIGEGSQLVGPTTQQDIGGAGC